MPIFFGLCSLSSLCLETGSFYPFSADVRSSGRGLRVIREFGTRNKSESVGTPAVTPALIKERWLD